MNHLYLQTAFLGDLLLSIPSLKRMRIWDPQAHITLLCRKGLGEVMQNLRVCDEVIEVDKKDKKSLEALMSKITEKEYDYIFSPHQSLRSHGYVKNIKAKYKVGYKKIWNKSHFTHRARRSLDLPEAIRQLELLALVDKDLYEKIDRYTYSEENFNVPSWAKMSIPHLAWPEEDYSVIEAKLLKQFDFSKPYICIAPGSVWPTKRWTEDGFVRSSIMLAREGFQIVILGAPDERELCERVQRQIPRSVSMAGNLSIWQSMMVLSKAKALICNDSGAMHMAAVVETPLVSIFGPTVKELGYRPWSDESVVLENHKLLCRPCGQHGSIKCPIGTHDCMKSVKPQEVLKSLGSMVSL